MSWPRFVPQLRNWVPKFVVAVEIKKERKSAARIVLANAHAKEDADLRAVALVLEIGGEVEVVAEVDAAEAEA